MTHLSGVGQHHLFRGLLPATAAALLASALLLLGAGMWMDHHLGILAREMAMRVAPGEHTTQEFDLAVTDYILAATVGAEGDDRVLVESTERLDSAARAYDGWARAAGLATMVSVEPNVHELEERVALANPTGRALDARQLYGAIDEMNNVLRGNSQAISEDTVRKLRGIADCQQRRRWMEMTLMGLLSGGCLALLFSARHRERRTCAAESEAMRTLQQTNADLEAFAGRVAHDLRNPLAPILSGSQIIENLPVDDKVRRAAERIERSARRLARMIDLLLDFSRLSSRSSVAECDVPAVVDDVAEGFRERARTEGVRLTVEAEPIRALCEPIVLASPLQNLIENAFKYGRRPGAERVIEVRGCRRGNWVVVEVEDRGPGIDIAQTDQLFGAFARGVDGGEGVGLGLATARRLVESRNGTVRLRVGRHGGALFQIRVPMAPPRDASAPKVVVPSA
ncbi:MAG: histidine kinase [Myxococcales bacterium]|nr:histidine kinase [Myxococcales bacterium]